MLRQLAKEVGPKLMRILKKVTDDFKESKQF